MISDYFPRHRRALAMAVWGLALPLGGMFGFAFGGKLTAILGWRDTFKVVGLAGLAMAPIVLIFLREPRRGRFETSHPLAATRRTIGQSIALLWNLRSFRYLVIAEALQAWAQAAMMAWNAPFYSRIHAMPIGEIATWLALIVGFGGAVGTFLGGAVAERLGKRDVRWYLRIPSIAAFLTIPFALAQYFTGDVRLSLAAAVIPAVMVNVYMAPGNAVSQSLAPPEMRAFTSAVFVLVVSLVGTGLGPTVTGLLSDLFAARFGLGEAAVRYALPTCLIPALAGALFFWRAASHLPNELRSLHDIAPVADNDAEPVAVVAG